MARALQESDPKSWKLLARLRLRLEPFLEAAAKSPTGQDPRREVPAGDCFCLLLFGRFNPALKSMRALCHSWVWDGRDAFVRMLQGSPPHAAFMVLTPNPISTPIRENGVMRSYLRIVVESAFYAAMCLLLSGCGGTAFKSAFIDYGDVYADTENHQMLLNLVRLSEHHPTYFFQQGNITANYEFTGTVSAQGAEDDKSQFVGSTPVRFFNWIAGPFSASATRSSRPIFNFIPLNGGDFAAESIAPLPAETLHAFFRDGFPVDVLMRCLVQEVTFTTPDTGKQLILYNVPSLENKTNYAIFLRLCAVLRQLQDRGDLYLSPIKVSRVGTAVGPESTNEPTSSDLMTAIDKGLIWHRESDAHWQLERQTTNDVSLQFQINQDGIDYLQTIQTDRPFRVQDIRRLEAVLGPGSTNEAPTAGLRSFLSVLSEMGQEEPAISSFGW